MWSPWQCTDPSKGSCRTIFLYDLTINFEVKNAVSLTKTTDIGETNIENNRSRIFVVTTMLISRFHACSSRIGWFTITTWYRRNNSRHEYTSVQLTKNKQPRTVVGGFHQWNCQASSCSSSYRTLYSWDLKLRINEGKELQNQAEHHPK